MSEEESSSVVEVLFVWRRLLTACCLLEPPLYTLCMALTLLPSMSYSRLRIQDSATATAKTAITAIFNRVPS